jgi:hypothetical protein
MATLSIDAQHLDEVVTAYVEWHRHSQCVQVAYAAWSSADPAEKQRRYAAYLEELDREQCACELYAATVARAGAPIGAAAPARADVAPKTRRRSAGH